VFGRTGTPVAGWTGSNSLTDPDKGQLQTCIAHQTIGALRKIGILDDVIATKAGLVVYLKEMNEPA
jgi:hypothetical protein